MFPTKPSLVGCLRTSSAPWSPRLFNECVQRGAPLRGGWSYSELAFSARISGFVEITLSVAPFVVLDIRAGLVEREPSQLCVKQNSFLFSLFCCCSGYGFPFDALVLSSTTCLLFITRSCLLFRSHQCSPLSLRHLKFSTGTRSWTISPTIKH